MTLPFREQSFDVELSENVLHHTPSTQKAIERVARFVKPGGDYAIYFYSKKSLVREFTDDFIGDRLFYTPSEQEWDALKPLTKLGATLGRLETEIDVEEAVDLLAIPAGRVDEQRLFIGMSVRCSIART